MKTDKEFETCPVEVAKRNFDPEKLKKQSKR
jgi:hypothetical protein